MSDRNFTGFTPDTLQFLNDLAANNRKEWFDAHRDEYRLCLQEPLQALAAELADFMSSIDPDLITIPQRVISRIYRDTRFSRDKSPYKTTMWLTFKRPLEHWQDAPAWFLEISPDSWRYGMGFYSSTSATMEKLRGELSSDRPALLAAIDSCRERFVVEGERYKRLPVAVFPEGLKEWFERKSVYLVCNKQPNAVFFSPGLAGELRSGFQLLAPLYHEMWRLRIL